MKVFRRLLVFLRPYRTGVSWSFLLAGLAMGTTVAIPFLVGRTIDQIRRGQTNLWPLAGAILAAALLRLAFSASRRLVAGRVSLAVEFDLRNLMYGHLQSLELGFFDAQQTGQLMSRSTVDLQAVRFFLGYGLIFIMQSSITIVIAAAVMIAVNPGLAAITLAPTPFVVWIAFVYGRKNRPATQEVQQRIAELTAEAEENVSGIRVVKAFAQEARQLARFRVAVKRVFDPVDDLHPAERLLQPPHRVPAEPRARRAPVRRRAAGDPPPDHRRRVRCLLRLRVTQRRGDFRH